MAGSHILIKLTGMAPVQKRLGDLAAHLKDLQPVFADIGETLLISHRERWALQQAPDGASWAPLSAATLARKKKNLDKILVEGGYLRGTLDYQAKTDSLLFGTPMTYGAVHQFGAKKGSLGATSSGAPIPWGDIPARPFLGISRTDEEAIMRILDSWLMRA